MLNRGAQRRSTSVADRWKIAATRAYDAERRALEFFVPVVCVGRLEEVAHGADPNLTPKIQKNDKSIILRCNQRCKDLVEQVAHLLDSQEAPELKKKLFEKLSEEAFKVSESYMARDKLLVILRTRAFREDGAFQRRHGVGSTYAERDKQLVMTQILLMHLEQQLVVERKLSDAGSQCTRVRLRCELDLLVEKNHNMPRLKEATALTVGNPTETAVLEAFLAREIVATGGWAAARDEAAAREAAAAVDASRPAAVVEAGTPPSPPTTTTTTTAQARANAPPGASSASPPPSADEPPLAWRRVEGRLMLHNPSSSRRRQVEIRAVPLRLTLGQNFAVVKVKPLRFHIDPEQLVEMRQGYLLGERGGGRRTRLMVTCVSHRLKAPDGGGGGGGEPPGDFVLPIRPRTLPLAAAAMPPSTSSRRKRHETRIQFGVRQQQAISSGMGGLTSGAGGGGVGVLGGGGTSY